jgi:chromosome segregation protein
MRLKQLKLAGFKSFVEPTIIPFPSQLVAVVGPNGCGKSNVIDGLDVRDVLKNCYIYLD